MRKRLVRGTTEVNFVMAAKKIKTPVGMLVYELGV